MAKVQVQESQVEDLVKSGELQFPDGLDVNVINPEGKAVSIPSIELKDALNSGYRYETAFKGAVRKKIDENDNLAGTLKTFAGQAADEFLMGVPETAFDLTSNPFDRAVKEGLKERHEVANALGGLAGFAGSMMYGGPIGKLATLGAKAGGRAGEVVAAKLAEAGVKRGSEKIAKDILARTAENATRMGVEGAIISSPMSITESALGDPMAGAESLMIGGGIGAAFGLATGATGALFNRLNKFVNKRASAAIEESHFRSPVGERTMPNPEKMGDGTLLSAAEAEGADQGILKNISAELGKKKPNSKEIAEASNELGLPLLEEQVAASKTIQDMASAISQRPTIPGIQRAQEYSKRYRRYDEAIRKSLGVDDIQTSRFEVGSKVKSRMVGAAKEAIDKEGQIFNQLRMEYSQIPLDAKPMKAVLKNIKDLAAGEIDDEAIGVLNNVSKKIEAGRLGNLNDLSEMRTILYDMYGPNVRKNKALKEIVQKLNYQEEETINRAIKARIKAASVPGQATLDDAVQLQGLYDDMQAAKGRWAELSGGLEEGADALSLGNVKSPRDFVRKVENLTPEQLTQRMMPRMDTESRRLLAKKFPEEFKMMSDFTKAKLLEDVVVDGQINARAFMRKFRQMEPELQEELFGHGGTRLLKAVRTDLESLPQNVNPSGTAKTLEWFKALSPSNILQSGVDALAISGMKKAVSVEGLLGVEQQMKTVRSRLDKVGDYVSALGRQVSASTSVGKEISAIQALSGSDKLADSEAYEKVKKDLSDAVANPQAAIDKAAGQTFGLADSGAPGISSAFGQNLIRAVGYLHSSLPKDLTPQSQFYKVENKPSSTELAAFGRKASVVMDPFVVLDALKDNTLTKDHVEALGVNYPMIYQSIRNRIINHVAENKLEIPYQNRLKLSLLMGFDIDQTTIPQYIRTFQDAFMMPGMNEPENDGLKVSGLERLEPGETMATPTQKSLASG